MWKNPHWVRLCQTTSLVAWINSKYHVYTTSGSRLFVRTFITKRELHPSKMDSLQLSCWIWPNTPASSAWWADWSCGFPGIISWSVIRYWTCEIHSSTLHAAMGWPSFFELSVMVNLVISSGDCLPFILGLLLLTVLLIGSSSCIALLSLLLVSFWQWLRCLSWLLSDPLNCTVNQLWSVRASHLINALLAFSPWFWYRWQCSYYRQRSAGPLSAGQFLLCQILFFVKSHCCCCAFFRNYLSSWNCHVVGWKGCGQS